MKKINNHELELKKITLEILFKVVKEKKENLINNVDTLFNSKEAIEKMFINVMFDLSFYEAYIDYFNIGNNCICDCYKIKHNIIAFLRTALPSDFDKLFELAKDNKYKDFIKDYLEVNKDDSSIH